jgi:hypothetical protein
MKQYATRRELHEDMKPLYHIVSYLCCAMEELNKVDSDGSPLPAYLAYSDSAYGITKRALREVILAHFGFDLDTVEVDWGACGGCWSHDVKEVLVQHLVTA